MGALIFGLLGGICMVLGILSALEILPALKEGLTWIFWFGISGLLLLLAITFGVGRGGGGGEY